MAYLTHEYAWAVAHTGGITLLDGELFAVGCLWTWPLLGDDPRPATLGIGWKVLYSLFGVVFYSVVGLAIQSQNRPIAPALAIADFHTGAGVLWSVGSLWSITLAIGVVVQWLMVDEGHALRADRSNAEEDARQLAIWRAERRAAGMADLRARGSVVVGSRPAGTPRADASARSARRSRRQ
jgi:putative copper resistance protein D